MSDFIKVNFKNGGNAIYPKKELHLESFECGVYYASTLTSAILLLACCAQVEKDETKSEVWEGNKYRWQITGEEYDRLCKELGVEA